MWPNTGSIVVLRIRIMSPPRSDFSFAFIAATNTSLVDADGEPSLRGLPRRACFATAMNNSGAFGIDPFTFSIPNAPE